MRTKYSVLNVLSGMLSQLLLVAVGLVSRKVFIDTLGVSMQGINATLTAVISMLSLTELGIGTAIICNLYKPLAEDDHPAITALMQMYSRIYRIIAGIVTILGVLVVPFLPKILDEKDAASFSQSYLTVVYLLFLADVVISYLFAYKRSIITADQKNYIVTAVSTASALMLNVVQIAILLKTGNFVLYLTIKIFFRIVENLVIAGIANRRYPFIRTREKLQVPQTTRYNIFSNTKALALHYIGNYLISGTDMMIITKFLGAAVSGVYSNYYLIISTLRTVFAQISTGGITASFGHLLAVGSKEELYTTFKKAVFVVFTLSNFASISLYCMIGDFMNLWLPGVDQLSTPVVLILCVNFYIAAFSETIGGLRAGAGLFRPDRYLHLFLAALNLVISIVLVQRIGMFGVFLGTLLCLIIKELTVLPYIVYSNIFEKPFYLYQIILLKYFLATFASGIATVWICSLVQVDSALVSLFAHAAICVVVPNLCVVLLFFRTKEFKYLISLIKSIMNRLLHRGQEGVSNG